MADNVEVKFGADATQMAKEFEKMRDKVASLTATVDRLAEKSKQGGKAGKDAFKGMGDELMGFAQKAVGITAIYAAITRGISAVIEKTKELRALRDESAISTSASLNKINKEYKLEGAEQDKMQGWIQGQAQANKMKLDKLAGFVAEGGNEGISKEDLYSNKYKSAIQLLSTSEKLTGEQAVNLLQTGLKKMGKDLKDAKKSDIDKVTSLYATMGGDIADADTELGQLDKKIPFEQAVTLIDTAKKNRYGKGKKSAGDINEGYKKGGLKGAAKAAGYESFEQFQADMAQRDKEAETALPTLFRIQSGSREAEIAVSENKKQFAFEQTQRDAQLEKSLKDERLAKEETEGVNYVDRKLADWGAGIFGEQMEKEARERRATGSGFEATEYAIDYYKNLIMQGNQKIEDQNTQRAKDMAKKPIDKTTDSKGAR